MRRPVLALALLAAPAWSHFSMLQPPSVHAIENGGKGAPPCGEGPDSNVVTGVIGGRPLAIRLGEFVFHPGHYRVALSVNSRAELPPDPEVTLDSNGISISAVIQKQVKAPVLADGLFAHTLPPNGDWETSLVLPNLNCDRCTLQIIEFMADHGFNDGGGYYYHHCADLRITADPNLPPADASWPRAAVPTTAAFPHIVAGGGWSTLLRLVNPTAAPVPASITFRTAAGAPLRLSVNAGDQAMQITSTFTATIAPNATLQIAPGDPPDSLVTGWAEVRGAGALSGYAVYRYGSAETAVPLQVAGTALTLPFDNTGGNDTTVGLTNSSLDEGSLTVTIWDDAGTQLGAPAVLIGASGHVDFTVASLLPAAAGKRGTLRIQGAVTGIALRVHPSGTLAALPPL